MEEAARPITPRRASFKTIAQLYDAVDDRQEERHVVGVCVRVRAVAVPWLKNYHVPLLLENRSPALLLQLKS